MLKRAILMAVLATMALPPIVAAHEEHFLGKWDVKMNFNGNEITATLTIEKDDGKLAGKWAGPRGEGPVSNIKIEGHTIRFERVIDAQGQELTIRYWAELKDEKLEGDIETPQGSASFTATKVKAE